MKRTLLILSSLVLATPAAAQSSNRVLEPLLESWGFPQQALSIFFGSEANARRLLGPPAEESLEENAFYGGPEYRMLVFELLPGRTLTLMLCTEHERQGRGITRAQVFCGMELGALSPPEGHHEAAGLLQLVAERSFGECDTSYYVFDGVIVSFSGRDAPRGRLDTIVLEPFARPYEQTPKSMDTKFLAAGWMP